jgi:Rhodopirellula transposase DDE domain
MELTAAACELLKQTAKTFTGAERRRFMARTVGAFSLSQRQAEIHLGWSRDTIRKAQHELRTGITCRDNFQARGRKPAEHRLPLLLQDVTDLVKDHLQTDPTFRTTGLYCRLSAREVRDQLIRRKGYTDGQLPCVQTIGEKLNRLGFRLRSVVKSRPQKGSKRPTPSSAT